MQSLNIGFKVNRNDSIVLALFLVAAFGFVIAAYRQHVQGQLTQQLAAQGRYNATPEDVIGKRAHSCGALNCPYTLVEFGDYQCAPCPQAQVTVLGAIRHGQSSLIIQS
jgi:hypothetical protein